MGFLLMEGGYLAHGVGNVPISARLLQMSVSGAQPNRRP